MCEVSAYSKLQFGDIPIGPSVLRIGAHLTDDEANGGGEVQLNIELLIEQQIRGTTNGRCLRAKVEVFEGVHLHANNAVCRRRKRRRNYGEGRNLK